MRESAKPVTRPRQVLLLYHDLDVAESKMFEVRRTFRGSLTPRSPQALLPKHLSTPRERVARQQSVPPCERALGHRSVADAEKRTCHFPLQEDTSGMTNLRAIIHGESSEGYVELPGATPSSGCLVKLSVLFFYVLPFFHSTFRWGHLIQFFP